MSGFSDSLLLPGVCEEQSKQEPQRIPQGKGYKQGKNMV